MGTVKGTVTLDGEPAPEGCIVAFISIDGHTASGKVGPGGSFRLHAGETGGNVPAATYAVSISPPAPAGASEVDPDKVMEAESAGGGRQEAQSQPAKEVDVRPSGAYGPDVDVVFLEPICLIERCRFVIGLSIRENDHCPPPRSFLKHLIGSFQAP